MKKTTIVLAVLFFSSLHLQAQFFDDMESYTPGEAISQDHWTEWDCAVGIGCNIISNSDLAHTGTLSGIIPGDGTTKAVLGLGDKIFGGWTLEFWAYIPSGKEAIFSLQGTVPIGDDNSIVGDILFNPGLNSPGSGKITDTFLGEISFDFPHDEWFKLTMYWDIYAGISIATWELWIDDLEVIPVGTIYANALGETAISLGGILFSSASLDNEIYLDDFNYYSGLIGVNEFDLDNVAIYPNPAVDVLYIETQNKLTSHKLYSLQGQLVMERSNSSKINVSSLTSGIYFLELETNQGKSVQKFIKK